MAQGFHGKAHESLATGEVACAHVDGFAFGGDALRARKRMRRNRA
jgi:hypothetical protein